MNVFLRYSPNHNERPPEPVSLLVMHYTGMESGDAALSWLCNPESHVSAHYLIEENGDIFQMVEEDRRAWHAGVSHWGLCDNVNHISIGIEIVNPGHERGYRIFPDAQIKAVMHISHDIMRRHAIQPSAVIGHSDIAPSRKEDPGELFPWRELAAHGIGIWHHIDDGEYSTKGYSKLPQTSRQQLADFGYTAEDCDTDIVIAFQRHYRPSLLSGTWDEDCQMRLDALLSIKQNEPPIDD